MSTEQRLYETFRAHEHLAPDAGTVLQEIERQIPRRQHRSRLLGIAAAALAVAGIAAAATTLTDHAHHEAPVRSTTRTATSAPTGSIVSIRPSPVVTGDVMQIPLTGYTIPITKTGNFAYTSPPLQLPRPITHGPASMSLVWRIVGGHAAIGGNFRLTPDNGGWSGPLVIKGQYRIASFTGHPFIQFDHVTIVGG